MLPSLKSKREQKVAIYIDAATAHYSVTVCADAASWQLLVRSGDCGYDNSMSSTTQNAALLWENARASVKVRLLPA